MTKEEAIKRIKDWNLDNDKMEVLSVIIPELKESEDERIKNELISLFKDGIKGISHRYTGEDCERWVAWLEKQGERKSVEYTLKDAASIFLDALSKTPYNNKPITDAQIITRELLTFLSDACSYNPDAINEQKPAWSEEDEKIKHELEVILTNTNLFSIFALNYTFSDMISWLKSLKERIQPQPKQELSKDAATNEYIDLGLPSGTIWKTFNEDGYYDFNEAVEKFGSKLPTKGQWEELKEVCKWEWKDNGYDVTGPNGNTIFFAADGYNYGTEVYDVGASGSYWSCTSDDEYSAWDMYFYSGGVDMCSTFHSPEFSVRLVK